MLIVLFQRVIERKGRNHILLLNDRRHNMKFGKFKKEFKNNKY